MKALVTGGAGFIGSNLVDALLARGDEVTVVDDLSTGRRENLDGALAAGAKLVELDIRDGAALAELAGASAPEVVFHLAAQIDVRKSIADPAFDASINVGGTANVLEAARAPAARRFVFVSTGGAIYGEGDGQAAAADRGRRRSSRFSAYGQSKFAAEGYLALYERLYGLSGVSLRLGNVYGPRQDPLGEAGVIAIFCGRLRAGGRPTVFGDGTQTRDYIYVGDVVAAALAAAESEATGADQRRHRRRDRRAGAGPRCSASWAAARASSPSSRRPAPARCSGSRSTRRRAERELGWRAADRPRRRPARLDAGSTRSSEPPAASGH